MGLVHRYAIYILCTSFFARGAKGGDRGGMREEKGIS